MSYEIGKVYEREGKLIYITSGAFWRNGHISNAWTWNIVLPDGTLGEKGHGYGESNPKPIDVEVIINVRLK